MEQKNTLMGILAYLGPLVIIPLVAEKHDPFVKFHAKQGLVLLIIDVIIYAIGMAFWPFWYFIQLLNLALLVLAVMGIIHVINGKEEPLPIVGDLAKHFKF